MAKPLFCNQKILSSILSVSLQMFTSPLEQFTVYKLVSLTVGAVDLSFTNSSLIAVLCTCLALLLTSMVCSGSKVIPTAWQSVIEALYNFVYSNVVAENIKKDGAKYFPFLFSIFAFILCCNLIGMIPYSFTVTSHIVITLGLATMAFVGINVIGISTHGFHMLSLFLPPGAPLGLAPLLVAIELVSYSFRVVSLALRLFANMMSGHCLLKILAGFA